MLHDLTVNSDYATLKQTAAERTMWRHSRGISRTKLYSRRLKRVRSHDEKFTTTVQGQSSMSQCM